MRIFHRKSRWQRFSDQLTTGVTRMPTGKVSAAAAGVAALTAASAAVSAYRRKTRP